MRGVSRLGKDQGKAWGGRAAGRTDGRADGRTAGGTDGRREGLGKGLENRSIRTNSAEKCTPVQLSPEASHLKCKQVSPSREFQFCDHTRRHTCPIVPCSGP